MNRSGLGSDLKSTGEEISFFENQIKTNPGRKKKKR